MIKNKQEFSKKVFSGNEKVHFLSILSFSDNSKNIKKKKKFLHEFQELAED